MQFLSWNGQFDNIFLHVCNLSITGKFVVTSFMFLSWNEQNFHWNCCQYCLINYLDSAYWNLGKAKGLPRKRLCLACCGSTKGWAAAVACESRGCIWFWYSRFWYSRFGWFWLCCIAPRLTREVHDWKPDSWPKR